MISALPLRLFTASSGELQARIPVDGTDADVRVGPSRNAPSEKEERKEQGYPRRLNEPHPDTKRSGTAGAIDFAG